jgi:hypothetical protein
VWARLAAPRAAVWEDAHASACGLRRAEDLGFGSPADSAKAAATAKGCEQFRDRVGGGVQGLNLTLLEALAVRFSPAASTDSLLTIKVPDAGRDQRDLTAHDEWIARTTGWTWPLGFSGANASTRDELAVAHRAGLMAGEALKYIVPPPARPNLAQVAVSTGVVDRALRVGGWLCYATLVETYLAARPRAFFVSADAAARLRGWCGDAAARPDRLGTVLARMHNGLGNQMWIYAFGRALAESLGFRHAPSKLRVEEAPHADHLLPPNTDLARAGRRARAERSREGRRAARAAARQGHPPHVRAADVPAHRRLLPELRARAADQGARQVVAAAQPRVHRRDARGARAAARAERRRDAHPVVRQQARRDGRRAPQAAVPARATGDAVRDALDGHAAAVPEIGGVPHARDQIPRQDVPRALELSVGLQEAIPQQCVGRDRSISTRARAFLCESLAPRPAANYTVPVSCLLSDIRFIEASRR